MVTVTILELSMKCPSKPKNILYIYIINMHKKGVIMRVVFAFCFV